MRLSRTLSAAALAVILFAAPAIAADFTKPFTDDDGKPVKVCVEIEREQVPPKCLREIDLTLGLAARTALRQIYEDERGIAPEEKNRRGELAQALVGAGEVKLKAEDVAVVKKMIGKMYSPAIVYQAWRELDPPTK